MRVLPTVLGALLAGTAAVGVHERLLDRRAEFPPNADVLYVPPPNYLELMSLGYDEALADLIWIRALIFAGEHLGGHNVDAVARYVEAMNALAPRFRRAYVWGGITAVYGGQAKVDRPMVDQAIAIYRRGLSQFPEEHTILYPLGMLLTHQVASTAGYSDAEREAYEREGVEMIRKAAAFGADPLVRQYAATLITEHATDQLAIQFLEAQLVEAQDEAHRRLLRRKLSQLAGDDVTTSIERTRERFSTEHQAQAPYLPDSVYAVIR